MDGIQITLWAKHASTQPSTCIQHIDGLATLFCFTEINIRLIYEYSIFYIHRSTFFNELKKPAARFNKKSIVRRIQTRVAVGIHNDWVERLRNQSPTWYSQTAFIPLAIHCHLSDIVKIHRRTHTYRGFTGIFW